MKKVIGALFGLAILCVIGVVAVFMLPAGIGGPAGESWQATRRPP